MEVAKYACSKNRFFVMNLSAPFLCQFFKDPLSEILEYVDILFGNESVSYETYFLWTGNYYCSDT